MKPFQASSKLVQVNGETVLAVVAGTGVYRRQASRILAIHGIREPRAGAWYPQQAWLNAFRDLAQTLGPNSLFRIGLEIPGNALFPSLPDTVEAALGSIDAAYQVNHRGGDIGCYRFRSTGPRSGEVLCANPYPSDFDRGIIQAVLNLFPGQTGRATLDPAQPTRKDGGESCTFRVTW